jgi:hypothetical protein
MVKREQGTSHDHSSSNWCCLSAVFRVLIQERI